MGWFEKNSTVKSLPEENVPSATPGCSSGSPEAANSKKMQEKREEREAVEVAEDGLKLVISGAKVQCTLCTNPVGTLMVNFPVPTTQNKPTATEQDNTKTSLIFTGNCIKSPKVSIPCVAIIQLAKWQNTGSFKVQDKAPLLLKSTIKCMYGGVDIKIIDCGQRG
jgi:hypothetical protein